MATRTRAFVLAAAVLTLAACSSGTPTEPGGPNREDQPAPPKPDLTGGPASLPSVPIPGSASLDDVPAPPKPRLADHARARNDWPIPPKAGPLSPGAPSLHRLSIPGT